jgi:predicted nucleic acid-binding protein
MSAEFVDTNVFIYAYDRSAGAKHTKSIDLLTRLFDEGAGVLSVQVLSEFYFAVTKKSIVKAERAEVVIEDLVDWRIHQPGFDHALRAIKLQRKFKIRWWDALILNSAIEMGCSILWTEDFNNGQRYESVTARNPFI